MRPISKPIIKKGSLVNLGGRKGTLSGPHLPVPTFPHKVSPPGKNITILSLPFSYYKQQKMLQTTIFVCVLLSAVFVQQVPADEIVEDGHIETANRKSKISLKVALETIAYLHVLPNLLSKSASVDLDVKLKSMVCNLNLGPV